MFITDQGRPTFALLKINDDYRCTGHSEPMLLDVMDGIPGAASPYAHTPAGSQAPQRKFTTFVKLRKMV